MERLRIPIEFNRNKKEEVDLYNRLQKHSNPAAYIKDVLMGLVPIPGGYDKKKELEDDEKEDLLDI